MSNQEMSPDINNDHGHDLYTLDEVARRTRLSPSTIAREIRGGALEAVLIGKRSVRIPHESFVAWSRARPVEPRSGSAS